jgi:ubiquinone/menaquinone biosynthesis C-methylase UbiE
MSQVYNVLSNLEALMVSRTLDEDSPELKPYLEQGATVLEIGCGSGSIALDVAEAVKPGTVIGIDPVERFIETALRMAKEREVGNADFRVGDSYNLCFPDDTFDVVYSHTVLHYFYDPVRALREQARVAKKGGWVICAGVRDPNLVQRYPPCPAWEQVHEARVRYVGARQDRVKGNEQSVIGFGHTQAARRCPEWFAAAGLTELRMEVKPSGVDYAGALPDFRVMDMLPYDEADEYGYYAAYRQEYEEMIAEGLLDRATLEQALEESKAWYADPRAFHFRAVVFAAGRA